MAFEDDLRDRLSQMQAQYPQSGGNPFASSFSAEQAHISPEANATMNAGGQAGGPAGAGGAPPPPEPAPAEPLQSSLRANGFGAPSSASPSTTMYRQPDGTYGPNRPAEPTAAPLQLYGSSATQQAQTLTNYMRQLGVELPPSMRVGGTSPVDGLINNLIDQINTPGATDAARRMYAQQLAGLIQQRNATVQNPLFDWNTSTNVPGPTTRTPGELTGNIWPSSGNPPGISATVPPANAALLQQLIALMGDGGVTAEQRTAQEGQLVSDLEGSALRRRQLLADRLGGQVSGGVVTDQLNQIENASGADRASGLAQIRVGILGLQQKARETALSAILQQVGMASNEAQQMAALITQRQISQAQLANSSEQFGQNLNLQTLGLQQTGQNAKMNMVIQLMQLENLVDEQTRQQIQHLIDTFLSGGGTT